MPHLHCITSAVLCQADFSSPARTLYHALPAPFVDPYTSRPLLYRREGAGGFVVYSAGPDGKYDGGKPGDKAAPSNVRSRYPVVRTPG